MPNFFLIKSWPCEFSGSLVKNAYFYSAIIFFIGLLTSSKGSGFAPVPKINSQQLLQSVIKHLPGIEGNMSDFEGEASEGSYF